MYANPRQGAGRTQENGTMCCLLGKIEYRHTAALSAYCHVREVPHCQQVPRL
jgi:hypothetical protein